MCSGTSAYFGVVGLDGEVVSALYIGEGKKISYKGYSVKVTDSNGSASLSLSGKNYLVSCNQTTVIGLPVTGAKSVSIFTGLMKTKLSVTGTKAGISFTIPPVTEAIISLD